MELLSSDELLRFTQITQSNGIMRLICALICFTIAITSMNRRHELKGFKNLVYVGLSMGLWNLMLCLYWLVSDISLLPLFDSVMYVGISFSAYALFRYCLAYCFPSVTEHPKYRNMLHLLSIFPILTSILAITYPLHSLFESYDTNKIWYSPCREITITYGVWFYIHSGISYLMILGTATVFLIKSFLKTTKNRMAFLITSIAITGFAIQNFIANFTVTQNYYGYLSAFFHLWCINAFYWTSYFDIDESLVFYGKNQMFDRTSFPLFIFNMDNELIIANPKAIDILNEINHPFTKYCKYDEIFSSQVYFKQSNSFCTDQSEVQNNSCFLQNKNTGVIYYTQRHYVTSKLGKEIGYCIMFNNISSFDIYIRSLENKSYIDSLCQCWNRLLYDEKKLSFFDQNKRPLAILVADVDNVKQVNSSFGHNIGDEYLRTAADIIKKATGVAQNMFRIDGDYFVVLLEDRDESDLKNIFNEIEESCSQQKTVYPFHISLGYSIVTDNTTTYSESFEVADLNLQAQRKQRGII